MAQSDHTVLTDSLDAAVVDRGVTAGTTKPNGGGTFVYGFNSLQVVTGAVGLFANQVNYAPMASGGSVRAAIQRGVSGGTTGYSPFLFIGLQGPAVGDAGYLLGLQDDDPSHIVLRKGTVAAGLPAGSVDPTANQILLRSTNPVENGEWIHIRLDMIVNPSGDVVLRVFQSDLDATDVTAAVWEAIPGMDTFIDDALGINTGSAPYTSGRAGFGFACSDVTRRGFFDHLEIFRQL